MELEDPQDLRARFRKFPILTNERKQMSTKTLRKRISLVAVTALTAGVLSVVAVPSANAANIAAQNTIMITAGAGLKVGTGSNTTGAAIVAASTAARSLGLLYKDETTTTAQTATVLAGGALVLIGYETAATAQAFSATGGTFSTPVGGGGTLAATAVEYGTGNTSVTLSSTNATAVAVLWTAPSTAGTYTINSYASTNSTNFSANADRAYGTNRGNITVTVAASAATDAPVVANSSCVTDNQPGAQTTTTDSTATVSNGAPWFIKYALINAYGSDVTTSGNLVATVTGDAVVSIGSGTGQAAGTGTTVVAYGTGGSATTYDTLRVDQATAGAPVTTTVTLSYNGVTVCTKTVTIRGAVASMKIDSVGTGDIGTGSTNGVGSATWIADGTGRAGLFTVTLLDSAGNIATPTAGSEFSADSTSLTTTVTALAVADASKATSTSSSSPHAYSVGTFTCGPTAGSSKVKLKYTSSATGKITTGEFTARCADDPYTYTASFDKAAYNQGEIATLTVKFLDSKGNPANSMVAPGASTMVLPMLTFVSATGSATSLTKADGTVTYTLTVGTTTGMTAGTYTGIVDFTSLTAVAATKATPTYKLSTGGDTTTNADVLKSIVALIASINKQIQALQKLILKK